MVEALARALQLLQGLLLLRQPSTLTRMQGPGHNARRPGISDLIKRVGLTQHEQK
jgi:hypothetical protein